MLLVMPVACAEEGRRAVGEVGDDAEESQGAVSKSIGKSGYHRSSLHQVDDEVDDGKKRSREEMGESW